MAVILWHSLTSVVDCLPVTCVIVASKILATVYWLLYSYLELAVRNLVQSGQKHYAN